MGVQRDENMKVLWTVLTEALPPLILDVLSTLHWNAVFAEDERKARQSRK